MRHRLIWSCALLALTASAWPVAGRAEAPGHASRWTQGDIDAAKARCAVLLSKLAVVAIPVDPIREGTCGAPAPVQLISLGTAPQVALSPPPVVTCELAAALAGWLEQEVQPAARKLMGGPVIRIEVMSAYSCRNAYARLNGRLSEHGRANALDIAMFVTDRAEIALLKSDWGETRRDVAVRLAGAPGAIGHATPSDPAAAEDNALASLETSGPGALKGTISAADARNLPQPSRLGGPRAAARGDAGPGQRFLRRIHAAACRYFGTVLGPEANEAHRNHFHVDMAERPVRAICE